MGIEEKACGICILEVGRERKAGGDSRSQRVCGEQTVKRACLESLLASGARVAMAAMACIQGGRPLVTVSSCFDRQAMGAQVSPAYWHRSPRACPWLGWAKRKMAWCNLAGGEPALRGGSG